MFYSAPCPALFSGLEQISTAAEAQFGQQGTKYEKGAKQEVFQWRTVTSQLMTRAPHRHGCDRPRDVATTVTKSRDHRDTQVL